MIRTLLITAVVGLSTASAAEDMPRFDVEVHCKKIASFGTPYSETMFDGCMDMEQAAYNDLKGSWSDLAPSMQSHCKKIAAFGGPGSYAMLQGCVQMETAAANKNKGRQFKY